MWVEAVRSAPSVIDPIRAASKLHAVTTALLWEGAGARATREKSVKDIGWTCKSSSAKTPKVYGEYSLRNWHRNDKCDTGRPPVKSPAGAEVAEPSPGAAVHQEMGREGGRTGGGGRA